MNDQLHDLDRRAAEAAADLHRAAAVRPVPTFDPSRVTTALDTPAGGAGSVGRSRWLSVSIAAAVLLVIGGLTWAIAGRGGDGGNDVATDLPSEPVPYILDPPPAGAVQINRFNGDVTAMRSAGDLPNLHAFGPQGAPAQVLVVRQSYDDDASGRFDLAGRVAYPHPDAEAMGTNGIHVVDGDNSFDIVGGVGDAELRSIAAGTTLTPDAVTIEASALPDGWVEQGTLPMTTGGIIGSRIDARRPQVGVTYQQPSVDEGAAPTVTLQSGLAARSRLDLSGVFSDAVARTVDLDGTDASLWASNVGAHGSVLMVSWSPRPGLALALSVYGDPRLDVNGLLSMARRVRPATDDEWAALPDVSAGAGFEDGAAAIGSTSDGIRWRIDADRNEDGSPSGSFSLAVDPGSIPSSGSGSGSGNGSSATGVIGQPGFPSVTSVRADGLVGSVVGAAIDDDVASVSLTDADGRREDLEILSVPEVGRVVVGHLATSTGTLVALRGDGSEAGRYEIADDEEVEFVTLADGQIDGRNWEIFAAGGGEPSIEVEGLEPVETAAGDPVLLAAGEDIRVAAGLLATGQRAEVTADGVTVTVTATATPRVDGDGDGSVWVAEVGTGPATVVIRDASGAEVLRRDVAAQS